MRFVVLLCCAVVAGCAQIPVAQFTAYTQAFDAARPAAEAVLADYSSAKEELDQLEAERAAEQAATPVVAMAPYSTGYEAPSNGLDSPDDVTIRFLALQAITDYNAALGQLVGGASVEVQSQSIDGFVGAVSQLATLGGVALPAIGPAVAALQTVAAEIEKARLAGEFQDAVRDGAPVVAQMVDILKQDTESHYGLRFALANEEWTLLDADLKVLEAQDDGSGVVTAAIEDHKARLADNESRMEKLKDVLDAYNALLDTTRAALLELAHESARPADLDSILARVIPVVIQLKRDLAAYRNA